MGGFNLPPGCSTSDIDRAAGVGVPCDTCAHDADDCICPECPVCGETGNKNCYKPAPHGHGLNYNKAQRVSQTKAHIAMMEDNLNEEKMHLERLEAEPDDWKDDNGWPAYDE
jgi:hypothetical protein